MRFSITNPSLAALAGMLLAAVSTQAQLTVTEPSSDHWWVAQSLNTLRWTGSTPTEFTVYIANTDQAIITDKLALVAVQPTYEYSKTINPGILRPAGGYTMLLTNPINSSQVYATSQPFEIRAAGSPYPAQTTVSPSGSSASAGGSSQAAASASSASTTPRSDATTRYSTATYGPMLAGGVVAALSLYDLAYDVSGLRGAGFIPLAPLAKSGPGSAVFNGRVKK